MMLEAHVVIAGWRAFLGRNPDTVMLDGFRALPDKATLVDRLSQSPEFRSRVAQGMQTLLAAVRQFDADTETEGTGGSVVPLRVCEKISGMHGIIDAAPTVHRLTNALIIPMGCAHKPGVYDLDQGGSIFTPAAYRRGVPTLHLPMEADVATLNATGLPTAPQNIQYVYAGHLTGHYGHFLFSLLGRLWSLPKPLPPTMKIIVLNGQHIEEVFSWDFSGTILRTLGLQPSDFLVFREPTLFRSLLVPDPLIEECIGGHRAFSNFTRAIGQKLIADASLSTDDRPVFLTKMRSRSGVHTITNEEAFCAVLEQNGVEIVAPETLRFVDQVALWGRPLVTGVAGSALHTSVFREGSRYLALNLRDWVNSCQTILDRINDTHGTAVYAPGAIVDEGASASFRHVLRMTDPVATANDFLRWIEHERVRG